MAMRIRKDAAAEVQGPSAAEVVGPSAANVKKRRALGSPSQQRPIKRNKGVHAVATAQSETMAISVEQFLDNIKFVMERRPVEDVL
ncbi:hypothetical protein BGZ65_010010, partial [Modicella reniformis]